MKCRSDNCKRNRLRGHGWTEFACIASCARSIMHTWYEEPHRSMSAVVGLADSAQPDFRTIFESLPRPRPVNTRQMRIHGDGPRFLMFFPARWASRTGTACARRQGASPSHRCAVDLLSRRHDPERRPRTTRRHRHAAEQSSPGLRLIELLLAPVVASGSLACLRKLWPIKNDARIPRRNHGDTPMGLGISRIAGKEEKD